ncbi:MAG: insulinase family protein [Actinobacteria bacterium]|nr:insulinase family protein [Actinomycetota bacterium]
MTFYEKTVLDDGLTILTEEMDTVRSVAIGIWCAIGSRDESSSEAGMSHFMEHMMFKGTPTRSAVEISEAFDRLGAELNAYTSKECTCYYARILDQHAGDAMEILSDMVVNSSFTQESCESEREVVLEEISRYEDQPDEQVHELLAETLMPEHPLGLPVIGRKETVSGFDHDAAAAFHASHYRSGNIVVTAAGALKHDDIVAMVRERLALTEGPRTSRVHAVPTTEPRLQVVTKETEQAHICWGVTACSAQDPARFTLSVLDGVLGRGMASRLFQEIREKRGLAYAVYSYPALYQDTGQFAIYAGTRPDNAVAVIQLIRDEVAKIADSGITADELDRVRESIKGQMILGLESTRSRMSRLGSSEVTHSELLSLDEIVERFEAVTREDVHAMAQKLFDGNHALAIIAPFGEDAVQHLL